MISGDPLHDERALVALALALGAEALGPLSAGEQRLVAAATSAPRQLIGAARRGIDDGEDPLGDAFTRLRSPATRRSAGATYTPPALVAAMADWVAARAPVRIIDPGAGSARFAVAAGRRLPGAALVAVERDPLAALLARAHLVAAGLAARARVVPRDFRLLRLAPVTGPTAFLGNPPYVRHHQLRPREKAWLAAAAARLGLRASGLAGLHVHFLLAIARLARPGDLGALVTAGEWLDVNYGAVVRQLFLGALGGESLHVLAPEARAFEDAATTAAVMCFAAGATPALRQLRAVASPLELAPLAGGRAVPAEVLQAAPRWSPLFRAPRSAPAGWVQLGELCRVHRGQVTGANAVWIAGPHAPLPPSLLFAAVTRAKELFAAGAALSDTAGLRRVIDLPPNLDLLAPEDRALVERFLRDALARGADRGFIARTRRAWWSVGLRPPAPILATYMARRPPAFVRNLAGARHLNIAHGLYPRVPLSSRALDALARHLTESTSVADGRTYAGGLTKFEPKEMERLWVPPLEALEMCSAALRSAPGS